METLFRLTLKRPAHQPIDADAHIDLTQNSDLQISLAGATAAGNRRAELRRAARRFADAPEFVGAPEDLTLAPQLGRLATALTAFEAEASIAEADLLDAIEAAFGKPASELAAGRDLRGPVSALRDSLIAIKLLKEEHPRPIEALAGQLRDLEVVLAVIDGRAPQTGAALRSLRRRGLKLPSAAELESILSTREAADAQADERARLEAERRKQAEARIENFRRAREALDELMAFRGDDLSSSVQKGGEGTTVPEKLELDVLKTRALERHDRRETLGLNLLADPREGVSAPTGAHELVNESSVLSALAITGSKSLRTEEAAPPSLRLTDEAIARVSAPTAEVLRARGLSLAERPLDEVVSRVRDDLLTESERLDALLGRPMRHSFRRVGNKLVVTRVALPTTWNQITVGGLVPITPIFAPLDNRVPRTVGSVAPAGVADLLVVKQQLIGYETADIAHVENVLRGETKGRTHVRSRESETLTFLESETTTTEERDLESTSRFEMSRETERQIQEEAQLEAGLTVSGKYGPMVEFSAHADGKVTRAKEEGTKTASSYSQEVTQRSAQSLSHRILQRDSLRVTNEVVETNEHSVDNSAGNAHVSGVYQWLLKVYMDQMYNYGVRMLYDFMVPEPAAFLIDSLQNGHNAALALDKPLPFTLRPDQIDEYNYHTWITEYGATDVTPPPEPFLTKSLDYSAGGGKEDTAYQHSAQIAIDEGYEAIQAVVSCLNNTWSRRWVVDVAVGSRSRRFQGSDWTWTTSLASETGSVPFALSTWKALNVALAVEIKCARTERAMMLWRLDTHAKLTAAYRARLSEYEEKLAALEAEAGIAIEGRNPAFNKRLIQDELKKNCISILTAQHYDQFGAITSGAQGMPQIDLYENEAEGPYVRFFEQAFEWEHLTWVGYSYFWGRKDTWAERIAYEDVDPLFNDFLKSGYCRVVVPTRPGFEGALDHYLSYGELWEGGPLPAISSALYLPIADEIAERRDRPEGEVPQGDPWVVKIPTSLVKLRKDDALPTWTQDNDGNWVAG